MKSYQFRVCLVSVSSVVPPYSPESSFCPWWQTCFYSSWVLCLKTFTVNWPFVDPSPSVADIGIGSNWAWIRLFMWPERATALIKWHICYSRNPRPTPFLLHARLSWPLYKGQLCEDTAWRQPTETRMRALTGNQISPNPGMEYGSTGMSYLFIDATSNGVMLR